MRPPSSFRTLCARHIRNFATKAHTRPLLPPTLPLDTLFCLFRLPLFPQAVQGSAFLCVLVSCGTYVLSFAKTSTFIGIFARLCIFIHCVIACFFSYAFAFAVPAILFPLSLRVGRSRLDAALLHPVPHPAESHACRLIDSRLHSLSAIESLVPHFLDLFSSHTCDRRDVRSFCLYFSLTPDFCL